MLDQCTRLGRSLHTYCCLRYSNFSPGSRFELVETHMHQLNAMVDVYKALGGGWR